MASNPEATGNPAVEVVHEEAPRIPVIPFAISLPKSTLQNFDDPTPKGDVMALMGDNGIVGSIVLLQNSVMVWVGWGKLDVSSRGDEELLLKKAIASESGTTNKTKIGFGSGIPIMGQLVVAMPRTNYKGAFGGSTTDVPCSQIIGSASSDDQMLASQMASRLSTRSGRAVLVSCQLSSPTTGGGSGGDDEWTAGLDSEMISHRAAALAEKEVWRILQEQLPPNVES